MHEQTTSPSAPAADAFARLQEWFTTRMAELGVPGAALGVLHHHRTNSVALGIANLHTQAPVTTATAFQVASLTKVLTATGIVSLLDEDHALDTPLSTWYPPFAVADAGATAAATMRHLLSHSGGWADAPWPDGDLTAPSLAEVVGNIASAAQLAPPGELFNYSNSSFLLAGHILAVLAGTSYEEAITARLLQPLGMHNSGFSLASLGTPNVSVGHSEGEAGLEPNDPAAIAPAFNPAGGLVSTVDDMLRFVGFHAGTRPALTDPVSAAGRQAMREVQGPGGSLGPLAADAIGLGWMLTQAGPHQVAMSFGSDSGAAAGMALVADEQFGVVVLANSDPGLQLATETVSKALEIYFQSPLPTDTPVDLTPADLAALVGSYSIPNDLSFEVTVENADVTITSRAGGEIVPPLTGPVAMLSPTRGRMQIGAMPVLVDFVPAAGGGIGWIRQFARLAPREN